LLGFSAAADYRGRGAALADLAGSGRTSVLDIGVTAGFLAVFEVTVDDLAVVDLAVVAGFLAVVATLVLVDFLAVDAVAVVADVPGLRAVGAGTDGPEGGIIAVEPGGVVGVSTTWAPAGTPAGVAADALGGVGDFSGGEDLHPARTRKQANIMQIARRIGDSPSLDNVCTGTSAKVSRTFVIGHSRGGG
jgi:hypothetical protein